MKQKEWTIMVYMAADNNLAVDMAYAMEQIREVAGEGTDSLNLFVYYDGNSPEIPTLYCDFSDKDKPKYVSSCQVPHKLYPVPAEENENAAGPRSILNFVDWCVNKAEGKANRYGLIFSGHSLGFQDIGLFKDETSGKSMKMSDLFLLLQRLVWTKDQLADGPEGDERVRKTNEILEQRLGAFLNLPLIGLIKDRLPKAVVGWQGEREVRKTTEILGQKLDLLGFDSCVMGMIEVGYQFDAVAKTMIVSEGSVPSAGWTYAKILGGLAHGQHRSASAQKVAEHFVMDFIHSQDKFTIGGVSVDMAAWDMSQMGGLTKAFNELSHSLMKCFEDKNSRIYKQMERAILHVHWKCQSYMYDQNVDLGDFCELLGRECDLVKEALFGEGVEILEEVQDKCRRLLSKIRKAVILSGFSGGTYQYSNGISAFFPWSWEGYKVSQENYESLLIALEAKHEMTSSWADFLKKYLSDVALRKSEPLTPTDALSESKYRYQSGIRFDEHSDVPQEVSADDARTKLPGQQSSKLPGQQSSKLPGQQSSKLPGQQSSKLPGQQSSKLPGQQSSKLPGQQSSKLPGQQSSKLPGQQSSKLGGSGSDAVFNNLQVFKNIESLWNISGFSSKPEEDEPKS